MTSITQAEFARQIGKSRQYVGKLIKEGKLPQEKDGTIIPAVGLAALEQMKDPARELARRNDLNGDFDDDDDDAAPEKKGSNYNDAAIVHKIAQGKLAALAYEREAGNLVEKSEVERQAFDCARLVRDRLMLLPQEIAGTLVSMTNENDIQLYLRNKIRDALMEAGNNVSAGR